MNKELFILHPSSLLSLSLQNGVIRHEGGICRITQIRARLRPRIAWYVDGATRVMGSDKLALELELSPVGNGRHNHGFLLPTTIEHHVRAWVDLPGNVASGGAARCHDGNGCKVAGRIVRGGGQGRQLSRGPS